MPRPIKRKVAFTEEALIGILQSALAEIEETSVKATSQYNKQSRDIHDNTDIALVSKINSEYLKIRNESSEKKLSIARLIKDVIYKDSVKANGKDNGQQTEHVISSDDKKALFKMIKGGLDKKNIDLTLDEDKESSAG